MPQSRTQHHASMVAHSATSSTIDRAHQWPLCGRLLNSCRAPLFLGESRADIGPLVPSIKPRSDPLGEAMAGRKTTVSSLHQSASAANMEKFYREMMLQEARVALEPFVRCGRPQ